METQSIYTTEITYMYVSNIYNKCTYLYPLHRRYPTVWNENLHRINYSNLAQNHQIHGMKYQQILIFEMNLYKAMIGSNFYHNKQSLDLENLP